LASIGSPHRRPVKAGKEEHMTTSLGFIGGGRITAIFLEAWKDGGIPLRDITVSDGDATVLGRLQERFPEIRTVADNRVSAAQEVVFLSLHPPVAKAILPEIADVLRPEALLVSLAPVLTFQKLSALLGGFSRLARMIPNAPSMVHRGFNPVVFARELTVGDRTILNALFDPLGEHPEVEESKLEAYAILAAMGPTYFWFQWQVLRELAAEFGLGQGEADRALNAMLHGAAGLMFENGLDYASVNDTVPVKPLAEGQEGIERLFREKLTALHARLKV
jgi:pyrroline-5-carboxylate reductase